MRNPGIFILTHKESTMQYIGRDTNLPKAADDILAGKVSSCTSVHNAVQKYGSDAFDLEIIPYPGISKEALKAVKNWKIDQYNTLHPHGYNRKKCGTGGMYCDISKKKTSETLTGFKHNAIARANMSASKKGVPKSDAHRQSMCIAQKKRWARERNTTTRGIDNDEF